MTWCKTLFLLPWQQEVTFANCPVIEEKTAAAKTTETGVAGAVLQESGGVIVLEEKQRMPVRKSERKKK